MVLQSMNKLNKISPDEKNDGCIILKAKPTTTVIKYTLLFIKFGFFGNMLKKYIIEITFTISSN